MSAEQNEFEALRKLLALKKHEQPPPGYFGQFSSEVRARLAAGEHRQSDLWRELGEEASWLHRLWAVFTEKPALAGAFGMAVCALMIGGIYLAQKPDAAAPTVAVDAWKLPSPGAAQQAVPVTTANAMLASSTNPVPAVPVGGSLFERVEIPLQTAPVNFQQPGQ